MDGRCAEIGEGHAMQLQFVDLLLSETIQLLDDRWSSVSFE